VTKFAPHKALTLIAWGKLTFDETAVVLRVVGLAFQGCGVENNYFTETCSGSEAGSHLRLIDFVYHSTLGLRVIMKKKGLGGAPD